MQARKAAQEAEAAARLQSSDLLVEEYMKNLREQSLNAPRAASRLRDKRAKGLRGTGAGAGTGAAPAMATLPVMREEAGEEAKGAEAARTPGEAGGAGTEGGLDDLLASGQELMARLTGEGVRRLVPYLTLFRSSLTLMHSS